MLTLKNRGIWLLAALGLGISYALILRHAGLVQGAPNLVAPLDEAYIYHQYALSAGQGPAFHYLADSPASSGVSSILYLYLLSALQGMTPSLAWLGWAIGTCSLGLSLLGLRRLGQAWSPRSGAWLFPLLALTHGAWVAASFNGLETGLFLALLINSLATLARTPRSGTVWAWLMALAWCRPEGQVAAALLGYYAWRHQKQARLTRGLICLLAVLGPSLIWLKINGSILPDGLSAQSAGLWPLTWLLLAWAWPLDWHQYHETLVLAPLLIVGVGLCLASLRASRPKLGLALLITWIVFGLLSHLTFLKLTHESAERYQGSHGRMGRWLAQHPELGSRLAVVDAGILAYESGWPITDLGGTTDHAMALLARQGRGVVLEWLASQPLELRPSHAALQDRPDYSVTPLLRTGLLSLLETPGLEPGPTRLYTWNWQKLSSQTPPLRMLPPHARLIEEWNVSGKLFGVFSSNQKLQLEGGQVTRGETLRLRQPAPAGAFLLGRLRLANHARAWALAGQVAQGVDLAPSPATQYSEFILPVSFGADSIKIYLRDLKSGTEIEYASFHWWLFETAKSK